MSACIVCNNLEALCVQRIALDTKDHSALTVRQRLEQVMQTNIMRDGWMCAACQFDLTQIEMYYSLLRVFRDRFWESDRKWREQYQLEPKASVGFGSNLLLDSLEQIVFSPDSLTTGGMNSSTPQKQPGVSADMPIKVENDPLIDEVKPADDKQLPSKSTGDGDSDFEDFLDTPAPLEDMDVDDDISEDPEESTRSSTRKKKKISYAEDKDENSKDIKQPKSLRCSYCKKVCKDRIRLQKHMKIHRKPKLACQQCGKTFFKQTALETHLKSHNRKRRQWTRHPVVCCICEKQLKQPSELKPHMEAEHKDLDPRQCQVCPKKFLQELTLEQHTMIHSGELPYLCDICGHGFKRPTTLLRHKTVHSDNRPFQCEICNKVFKCGDYYREHVKGHTENNMCSICGKTFTTRDILRQHELRHNEDNHYPCTICNRKFTQKAHMINHLNTHKPKRERPPPKYICSVCGKGYHAVTQLRYHMMNHSGEWTCFCSVCGKGCVNEYVLARHMVSHTGQKTAMCPVCGKGFIHGGAVTKHMLSHTGEKPYKCRMCDKAYTDKKNLKKHIKNHHPGAPPNILDDY